MNQLPQKAIDELKILFQTHYSVDLSDEECKQEMYDLLYLYAFSQGKQHLLKPIY